MVPRWGPARNCIAKDPDERIHSARRLVSALRSWRLLRAGSEGDEPEGQRRSWLRDLQLGPSRRQGVLEGRRPPMTRLAVPEPSLAAALGFAALALSELARRSGGRGLGNPRAGSG